MNKKIVYIIIGLGLALVGCAKKNDNTPAPVPLKMNVVEYGYDGGEYQYIDSLNITHSVTGTGKFVFHTYQTNKIASITCNKPDSKNHSHMWILFNDKLPSDYYNFDSDNPRYNQPIPYPITIKF